MSFIITAPSKTFLLGEYAVLQGNPAVILTTEPRFTLTATEKTHQTKTVPGIHPDSPAGKMLTANAIYQPFDIEFVDPYQGLGGFGASSAQFLMLVALKAYITGHTFNEDDLLNEYLQFAWEGIGTPPSGADLIAQWQGKICYFEKNKKMLHSLTWPFPDLGYCLIHTHNKLATHNHLKELDVISMDELTEVTKSGWQAIQTSDSKYFVKAINDYARVLAEKKLVLKQTKILMAELSDHPSILAIKGCGALGADVILIVFALSKQSECIAWLESQNLHIIRYGQKVANGLEIGVS